LSTSSYENPPPYQTREHNGLHNSLLQQQHQQHMVQSSVNGFDLESSLPSPSSASHYDSIHSPQQQHHNGMPNVNDHHPSASMTPSPNTTIQNVSKSLKSNNRRASAASKLSSLLATATTPEPPIVSEVKGQVLQQRVSKFFFGKVTEQSWIFLGGFRRL
jgi:hypothetical protein